MNFVIITIPQTQQSYQTQGIGSDYIRKIIVRKISKTLEIWGNAKAKDIQTMDIAKVERV